MTGHTYLLKSRHGVYYFRAVEPSHARTHQCGPRREIRISLRTKNRALAKRLVAKKAYFMSKPFDLPGQAQADQDDALFDLGQTIASRIGRVDTDDARAVESMIEHLPLEEARAYLFYCTYVEEQEQRKRAKRNLVHVQVQKPPTGTLSVAGVSPPQSSAQPSVPADLPPRQSNTKSDSSSAAAIERYVQSRKVGGVKPATADRYGAQCRMFLRIIEKGRTNLMLSMIASDDLQHYVDSLPCVKKKSQPDAALIMVQARSKDAMDHKTTFAHAGAVKQFLIWCESQHYSVAANLSSILKPLLKKTKKSTNERVAFTDHQLRLLFECESYKNGTFKRASDYWVPLLGLFTGARQGELCQLHASDVYKASETDIWVIDINSRDGKSVKSEDSSPRQIPLHNQLIELGFLQYVAAASKQSRRMLFPDEERNKRGEFSAFSRRFNRYKRLLGVGAENEKHLDFHSFRHTVAGRLIGLGVEEYVVSDITGHSNAKRGEAHGRYSKSSFLTTKKGAIDKLTYPIAFSLIKPNGFTGPSGFADGADNAGQHA